jgi:hypothetical protein
VDPQLPRGPTLNPQLSALNLFKRSADSLSASSNPSLTVILGHCSRDHLRRFLKQIYCQTLNCLGASQQIIQQRFAPAGSQLKIKIFFFIAPCQAAFSPKTVHLF